MITAFLNVLWYYIDYLGEPSVKNGSLSLSAHWSFTNHLVANAD